jgi:flagellar biosynthesis protein FliR
MMGFPVSIGVAFIFLFLLVPFLTDAAARLIEASFRELSGLFGGIAGGA